MSIANFNVAPHETRFIPVQLCEVAISKHLIKPATLYIYLKFVCSGKIRLSNDDLNKVANDLNCCTKTVRNNLKKLLQEGWITYNAKSKIWFIKSFQRVMNIYNFIAKSRTALSFSNITKLKGFFAATYIGGMINQQLKTEKLSNGRNKCICPKTRIGKPVSNSGIAKCIGIAKSHAFSLKTKAEKDGFIECTKQFINTGLDAMFRYTYKLSMPELANRTRIIDGKVCLMKADLITHKILFKAKRKFFKK